MVLVQTWTFFQLYLLGNIGQENVFYGILERINAFLGYKNKKFKSHKIAFFPKGLAHGFGPKMAIFPTFFFQAIQARKMSFMIFQNEKTPFQAIKTRCPKSPKIDIFPNGLTHAFGPKMAIFPTFFFLAIQARKMSFTILQNEKTSLQAIIKVHKSESSNFSKGFNRRFWSKNGHFPKFIFYTIQAKKMSFTIFQNDKTPFQAKKTRSSNSRKIDIFYKGVNPCLWYKNGHFSNFFFSRNIAQENVFYDILERENASLGYKNKKFKKS